MKRKKKTLPLTNVDLKRDFIGIPFQGGHSKRLSNSL